MTHPPPMSLDGSTGLTEVAPGRYRASLSPGWWIEGTAFGGYLAALMLRAMSRQAPAGQRPLALTVMFGAAVRQDVAEVAVTVACRGSSTTIAAAVMKVGEAVVATAGATFGRAREARALAERSMPAVSAADLCAPMTVRLDVQQRFPLHARFGRRRLPDSGVPASFDAGGWIRLSEAQPLEYAAAVVLLDSWTAPAAAKVGSKRMLSLVYHVQFPATLPLAGLAADDFSLAAFTSAFVADGYAQEDGELWSHRGELVATSRQVVLVGS